MTSRLIAFLSFLPIFSCISAQGIACPPSSSLQTAVTIFTISSSPKSLASTLGDFYSDSWKSLFQTPITYTPTSLSRTLHFASESLDITESLLSPNPLLLQWQLSSGPFVLPSKSGDLKVLLYNQSLSLVPVCGGDSYTTVTWSIYACISPSLERQEEEEGPINWFKLQHHKAATNVFDTVSRGWFGPVSTDKEGTACPTYDTRDSVISTISSVSGALKEASVTPMTTTTAEVLSSVSLLSEDGEQVPTTTFTTSYPLIPLPVTVSLPAENATWSTIGVMSEETSMSTSFIPVATYIPGNGATRNGVEALVVAAAIVGWLCV